jgi:hypothetical protein
MTTLRHSGRSCLIVLLAACALALVGCESGNAMPARMRDRFQAPQAKVKVFAAERPVVFDAAREAMRQLDFQISRSGMAQGIINAHSRLQPAGSFGKARQYTMEVSLHSYEPGKTEVAVVLREQEESSSFAGATDMPIREHGLYTSFFAALEGVLKIQGTSPEQSPHP